MISVRISSAPLALTGLVVVAAALGACTDGDPPTGPKLTEVSWVRHTGAQIEVGKSTISYDGDQVRDIAIELDDEPAGRIDVEYTGDAPTTITYTDPGGDRGTRRSSFWEGRLSSRVDSVPTRGSVETSYQYDASEGDRLSGWITVGMTQSTPIRGEVWVGEGSCDYDDDGRLVTSSERLSSSVVAAEFDYDGDGRLVQQTTTGGAERAAINFFYDASGRLTSLIDDAGRLYEVRYDDEGRIDELRAQSVDAIWGEVITYRYAPGRASGLVFLPSLPTDRIDLLGTTMDAVDVRMMRAPSDTFDLPTPFTSANGGGGVDG